MEAAGHVVRESSGDYRLAYPNNGRFQPLKKMLESDWLPQAQELSLVEFLENLFARERGAIKRSEIEQIDLALVDVHVVKGKRAPAPNTGKPNGRARKRGAGRKQRYTPAQLEALKLQTFLLLNEYGDPEGDNPDPELRSISALIEKLGDWAVAKKPKDFREEPPPSTIRPYVNEWLEEWRRQQSAGN
jgi:hypothetical protein